VRPHCPHLPRAGLCGENVAIGLDHLVSLLLCILLVSTIVLVSWGMKEKILLGYADVGTDLSYKKM
jgi:hypothetical protein